MTRFLLFFGAQYEPSGGWEDFGGGFSSVEDAVAFVIRQPGTVDEQGPDWWHITDLETSMIVCEGRAEWLRPGPRKSH